MIKAINRNAIKSVLGGVRVQTWTIRIYVIREVVNFNLHYKQRNKQMLRRGAYTLRYFLRRARKSGTIHSRGG